MIRFRIRHSRLSRYRRRKSRSSVNIPSVVKRRIAVRLKPLRKSSRPSIELYFLFLIFKSRSRIEMNSERRRIFLSNAVRFSVPVYVRQKIVAVPRRFRIRTVYPRRYPTVYNGRSYSHSRRCRKTRTRRRTVSYLQRFSFTPQFARSENDVFSRRFFLGFFIAEPIPVRSPVPARYDELRKQRRMCDRRCFIFKTVAFYNRKSVSRRIPSFASYLL